MQRVQRPLVRPEEEFRITAGTFRRYWWPFGPVEFSVTPQRGSFEGRLLLVDTTSGKVRTVKEWTVTETTDSDCRLELLRVLRKVAKPWARAEVRRVRYQMREAAGRTVRRGAGAA